MVAQPSPSPDSRPVELWEASPGLTGFLLGFFVLAIILCFLMWSMQKHMRTIKHNAARQEATSPDPDTVRAGGAGADSPPAGAGEDKAGGPGNPGT